MTKENEHIIDRFVNFLIAENCEGCKECEPRLSCEWKQGFACKEEGQAKWFMEMGKLFKESEE